MDTEKRRESLHNSLLAPPVGDSNDGGKLYSNVGHNSGAFDGIKLGGVRMNYDILCGRSNERCETDENNNLKLNDRGHIVYRGDKESKHPKVSVLLADREESDKLFGATGGFQAIKGEMFGIPYKPDSFVDRLTETRGLSQEQEKKIDRFSLMAVPAVTPTTVPHALPLEVRFLLFGVR